MKNFYNIADAAREVGVCAGTLRVYEKEGALKPQRLPNGHRIFTADDIATAREIHNQRRRDGRKS